MAQNITTTVELPPAIETWYDTLLLVRLQSKLIHEQFAEIRNQPGKTGNTIKFRRYSNLSPATTKLTEGQTPDGQAVGQTDLTAKTAQYGDFVTITDIVDLTVQDAVMTEVASLLGDQAGQTRDILVKDMLGATASVTNAAGGSNPSATVTLPSNIFNTDINAIVQVLLSANAQMRTTVVSATPGVGTLPVREAYWGTINTDLLTGTNDLEGVTGFLHASEYPSQMTRLETEWGSTGNVRWVHSTNAFKDDTPEYRLNIIATNAYAITSITGGTLQFIIQQFGMGDDPLKQRMTSGWKFNHASRILNDNNLHILNVTAT